TTNGTGAVKDRPWHGYIDGLLSKKKPHEPIPRCLDVLKFLAREGNEKIWWNIDIKMDNSPNLILSKLALLIKENFPERDFSSQIVLGLWHPKFLPAADKYLPQYSRIHIGISLDIARTHFPPNTVDGYSINFMVLSTPEGRHFIKEMQASDKQILAWTVNDVLETRECVKMGIDYVLTDRTRIMDQVFNEYAQLGHEGVAAKYSGEVFNTWARQGRYMIWRLLIWLFISIKFSRATAQKEDEIIPELNEEVNRHSILD
ncbi:hypothetical protein BGW38_005685, partial [Lunasporangiospora selenospora]